MPGMSKPPFSMAITASSIAAATILLASSVCLWHRLARKAKSSSPSNRHATLEDLLKQNNGQLSVKPIGHVRSVYRLCVGTPRQGLLAPHARGCLELTGVSMDAVDGLEQYSHVWVVFVFHLNTVGRRVPNKIAPPALGGRKVGTLATRTPHRFNPIGISLCKLDSLRRSSTVHNTPVLEVSGLDLVDNTPILDVKPYVGYYDSVATVGDSDGDCARVPSWVADGLETRRPVHLESTALEELEDILRSKPKALEFYGKPEASLETTLESVENCIAEVLSVDVRSSYQTSKARQGRFQAERAQRMQRKLVQKEQESSCSNTNRCTQQLDNLLIHYRVEQARDQVRSESDGSGAEDTVYVDSIQLLVDRDKTGETRMKDDEDKIESIGGGLAVDATGGPISANATSQRPSPVGEAPTDGDYSTLKSYWNQAANKNTPTGITPVDTPTGMPPRERRVTRTFFSPDSATVRK